MRKKQAYFLCAALLGVAGFAHAEKADRTQEVEILFARTEGMAAENGEVTVSGDVVLTQGTLKVTAERMKVKKDARENVTVEMFGTAGKQITFRAKRDNTNEFMEGVADRAEFDQRKGVVKLIGRANAKSGTFVMSSEYIFYSQDTEQFEVGNPNPKAGDAPAARSRIVIPAPKPDTEKK